jgi:hypothetical protein
MSAGVHKYSAANRRRNPRRELETRKAIIRRATSEAHQGCSAEHLKTRAVNLNPLEPSTELDYPLIQTSITYENITSISEHSHRLALPMKEREHVSELLNGIYRHNRSQSPSNGERGKT